MILNPNNRHLCEKIIGVLEMYLKEGKTDNRVFEIASDIHGLQEEHWEEHQMSIRENDARTKELAQIEAEKDIAHQLGDCPTCHTSPVAAKPKISDNKAYCANCDTFLGDV